MARLKTLPLIVTAAAVVLTACGDTPVTPEPEEQPTVELRNVQEYYTGPLAERWTQRSPETEVLSAPPATAKGWTTLASVPTAFGFPFEGVEGMSVAAVGNNIIAAVGFDNSVGDVATTRIYDIASNTWSPAASAPGASSEGTAVSHGGLFYVVGGRGAGFTALWSYDPTTDFWTVLPPMPTGRNGLAAAVVGNAIYAIGGRTSGAPCSGGELATVERFDIGAGVWSTVASLPSARSGLAAVTVGGKIYVFGGCRSAFPFPTVLADVDVYNPVTDTWSTAPTDMPTPRAAMYAAASKGGTVYVIGGWDGIGSGLGTNEAYKVSKDKWTTGLPALPTPRAEAGAVGHGGRIYIVGGATPGFGASVAAMEVFKP